jgi:outer membrane protein insertion porin family/translocation and assembly module TamA
MKRLQRLFFVALLVWCSHAQAASVEDLDPYQEWSIKTLTIAGNKRFPADQLRGELVTTMRPWYTPWRSHPRFDPVTFKTDLDRLARFYRAQGYYDAQVSYSLNIQEADHLVTVGITIKEGEPVQVAQVNLEVTDNPDLTPALEALRPSLPLTAGSVFTEEHYQETEAKIKEFFLEQHRGRVKVERKATIILDQRAAQVRYTVEAGPPAVFGETRVEGTVQVAPEIVSREFTYKPGDPFSATAIAESRKNLLKLDLFSSVRFLEEESTADPTVIPMRARVDDKPFHEWQAGIGYGTEDQVRGQVRWRHNNWFGGGRRLEVQVKASSLIRDIEVSFLQPHAFGRQNRFSLTFRPQQLDEPSYLLNGTRLQPRFQRDFTSTLSGFVAYRLEYDRLSHVSPSTIHALQEFQRKGALSGFSVGLVRNTADDPLNPTRGTVVTFSAEQVGGVLGGDFNFMKFQGEAKGYHLITPRTVLAARIRLGFADPFDNSNEVPLFERFYAGGVNSVRGYGRYRLGPLSASDDPVGGRSLIEGSLEVRRQLLEKISGTLFLDFGQVSLHSFDVPVGDLKYSVGFSVLYTTPVGPVLLALGFPFDPPHGDQPWQVHFSIGQFF